MTQGPYRLIRVLSDTNITLIVIVILILLSLTGAIIPQQGTVENSAILQWQEEHPTVAPLVSKLGLFTTFHSPLFMTSLAVLFANTLACMINSILIDALFAQRNTSSRLRRIGFILLHTSILLCMAGGLITAGFRTSGQIIITEGQTLDDQRPAYRSLVKGPFRKNLHNRFRLHLFEAQFDSPDDWSSGRKRARIKLNSKNTESLESEVEFNHPVRFNGTAFTLQEIGFSPAVLITFHDPEIQPFNAFIALKVWGVNSQREHRDFLRLPNNMGNLMLNLFPSYTVTNGAAVKKSDDLTEPALLAHLELPNGTRTEEQLVALGKGVKFEKLDVQFPEIRRWASFIVAEDPGYPLVLFSFFLAVCSLLLRYSPDIFEWFKEARNDGTT